MIFKTISNQEQWDGFVQQFQHVSFLQSWSWGEFMRSQGYTPVYLGMFKEDTLVGASLVVLVHSKRGTYLECIGGPLFRTVGNEGQKHDSVRQEQEVGMDLAKSFVCDSGFVEWLEYIKSFAKKENAAYLRIRLHERDSSERHAFLKQYDFRETSLYYQAETTRILDVSTEPDTLFSQMDKQTRYDIRRAERDGVTIEIAIQLSGDNFQYFLELYHHMVVRQGYVGYTDLYLQKQYHSFVERGQASIYLAQYQGEYVAGAIVFKYGDTVTYHHAASVSVAKLSPASLIIWNIIKDARDNGYHYVDLFGVAPPGTRYASRMGLTKFKEGFGGEEFHWLRTHDLVLKPVQYFVTKTIEQLPGGIRSKGAAIFKLLR